MASSPTPSTPKSDTRHDAEYYLPSTLPRCSVPFPLPHRLFCVLAYLSLLLLFLPLSFSPFVYFFLNSSYPPNQNTHLPFLSSFFLTSPLPLKKCSRWLSSLIPNSCLHGELPPPTHFEILSLTLSSRPLKLEILLSLLRILSLPVLLCFFFPRLSFTPSLHLSARFLHLSPFSRSVRASLFSQLSYLPKASAHLFLELSLSLSISFSSSFCFRPIFLLSAPSPLLPILSRPSLLLTSLEPPCSHQAHLGGREVRG